MKFYRETILPFLVDRSLKGATIGEERGRALAGVSGTVLEVGFGTGLNLAWYPPGIERLLIVEPSPGMLRRAGERIAAAPFPVERIELRADGRYELDGESVDAVVTTLTLCTIPDPVAALREFRRVLRPGGRYHFLEHGAGDRPLIRFCQETINPVQRLIAGGCNLNRPIGDLIRRAGFADPALTRFALPKAPRIWATMYRGSAGL